jgi:hypothetical protein
VDRRGLEPLRHFEAANYYDPGFDRGGVAYPAFLEFVLAEDPAALGFITLIRVINRRLPLWPVPTSGSRVIRIAAHISAPGAPSCRLTATPGHLGRDGTPVGVSAL